MMEKKLSLHFALAYATWIIAFAALVVAWVADQRFVGFFGVFVTAIAATMTVCSQIRECAAETRNAISIVRHVEQGDLRPLR